ncbi:MAG: hypothetical protein IT305_26950 [Chloroflexi bacterium]|nr:hypothetical protein [Chloroflexota bacterium]
MSFLSTYRRLQDAARLDEHRANEVVQAARPHAAAALGLDGAAAETLNVVARRVEPSEARGGSVIPAWPFRADDNAVTIEFVDDWGAMLAAWRVAVGETGGDGLDVDAAIRTGQRVWVGIANDVLQMYVPNPPDGTYSMVRHHALMLGAATLWLGPSRARVWQHAHALAGRAFLDRLRGQPLWTAVEDAEQGLARLLDDPRGRTTARDVIRWLDGDSAAAGAFLDFLGAASLGIAALLATAPDDADPTPWLRHLIQHEHPDPAFNRDRIEAFAAVSGRA